MHRRLETSELFGKDFWLDVLKLDVATCVVSRLKERKERPQGEMGLRADEICFLASTSLWHSGVPLCVFVEDSGPSQIICVKNSSEDSPWVA